MLRHDKQEYPVEIFAPPATTAFLKNSLQKRDFVSHGENYSPSVNSTMTTSDKHLDITSSSTALGRSISNHDKTNFYKHDFQELVQAMENHRSTHHDSKQQANWTSAAA